MPIARDGWPYILTFVILGAAAALRWPWLGLGLVGLGLFTAFFFRDPERRIADGYRLIVSPADGRVVQVIAAPATNPLGAGATQVSIFLSIFNVHVNRSPIAGRISAVTYNKGAFLPAFDDKASLKNEQNCVTNEGGGQRVAFTQIAGLIARRIVFRKRPGDMVARGERVGLIKFGSRVDVFVPAGTALKVKVGDRVAGGLTVLGELPVTGER
jgi:phosphatidylserine decarboxylase